MSVSSARDMPAKRDPGGSPCTSASLGPAAYGSSPGGASAECFGPVPGELFVMNSRILDCLRLSSVVRRVPSSKHSRFGVTGLVAASPPLPPWEPDSMRFW